VKQLCARSLRHWQAAWLLIFCTSQNTCYGSTTLPGSKIALTATSELAAVLTRGYYAHALFSFLSLKESIMTVQRTFSIIKPDATERNLTGGVNAVIEKAGLRIVAQKRIHMTKAQAEAFYSVHSARPFFGELVEFMISAPVVVQVLEGENAIARYRDVMGATNPANAAEGTIRKLFAKSVGENSVHGSDAPETAAMEIAQFFSGNEIVG
jgi:nucleoside-diphosphate kinase